MADNITLNAGSGGATLAADDVASVWYQEVKLVHGGLDSATLVSTSSGLPVQAQGAFPVTDNAGSLTVDNAQLSVVGSGTEAAAMRVTIATDSTGVLSVDDNGSTISIDDGAGSITVDGTVAVSGTVTVGSHAVTNAGTFVTQENGAALTSLQLIDDVVYVEDAVAAANPSGVATMLVRTDTPATQVSADGDNVAQRGTNYGAAYVTMLDGSGNVIAGGTTYTEDVASAGDPVGSMMIAVRRDTLSTAEVSADGDNIAVKANSKGAVHVDASQGVAHDAADAGNAVKIGAKAETSPKGITLVADGDRTDLYADADGLQMVRLNTSGADLVSERVSDTAGSSAAFTNFSAVASTKNYITAFHVFRTDAGTTPIYVDFRDGTAGSILWTAVIPPNGGSNSPPYNGPALFKTSANTALAYDVSAATTTVYINVSGYQSKV